MRGARRNNSRFPRGCSKSWRSNPDSSALTAPGVKIAPFAAFRIRSFRFQWSADAGPGQVDLIFEVFNVFNSANRSISEDLQELPQANFGLTDLIGTARQAQIGVRYRF